MTRVRRSGVGVASSARLLACLAAWAVAGCGGPPVDGADWPMYRGDLAGTGHSPLAQITPANAADLTQAWTYSLRAAPAADPPSGADGAYPPEPRSQATPIVVNGVMYLPAADRVAALDPVTGRELWRRVPGDGAPSRRGVAYWPGEEGEEGLPPRILLTTGRRLIALDAATGAPVESFGRAGVVDLGVPYNSVPLVFRNVVVVGANTPPSEIGGVGNARAYDARTGAKLWEFASVAQPGDVGHDTWEGESWRGRLGVNAWPFYFTVDEARGLLYLPLASPIPGAYGGDRKGANLYGNSVVAVDVRTGEYRWHFQTIRHDLWDADPPAPPVLFDVERDGRAAPALGVTTKSGYLYVLDRETGEPVFGVEERPVPASDVPGEAAHPTQPFPVKPPPIGRVAYGPADLVTAADTSAEHAAACARLVESLGEIRNAGPFTPWVYRPARGPVRTTLNFPGGVGGPNWGGTAFDPASGHLFVVTQNVGALGWMVDAGYEAPLPYAKATPRPASFDVSLGDGPRLPCQKPPWGELIAVEAATGAIAWRRTLGVTDRLPPGRRRTGRPARAGAIVTAGGVLFVAATDDNRFRAFEAATGRALWETRLERQGNANPLTYLGADGRQYVAVAATDTLAAYAVP